MKKYRNPQTVHQPLAAYSHQIEVDSSERWLVLSGQVGMKQDGSIPNDPIDQLKAALKNIELNLQAANMKIEDIVKLTVYVAGEMEATERRQALKDFFKEVEPCMTFLFVKALASPDLVVEIDAMASSDTGE